MILEKQYPSGVTTFFDEDTEVFAEVQGYRPNKPFLSRAVGSTLRDLRRYRKSSKRSIPKLTLSNSGS